MGLFSSNKSSTSNNYTDNSANAGGANSIALGTNAHFTINDVSEAVAKEALATGNVSIGAMANVAGNALTANTAVAATAIDAGTKQTEFTVNTLKSIMETSARENADTRSAANESLDTVATLLAQMNATTDNITARAQTPEATGLATIIKPLAWAAVGIVLLIVLFKSKK